MDSTGDAGKEDDDESSSSLEVVAPPSERKGSSSETIQSALDEFRVKWQQELKKDGGSPSGGSPLREKPRSGGGSNASLQKDKENVSIEQQARALFLQGSELEHSGEVASIYYDFSTTLTQKG